MSEEANKGVEYAPLDEAAIKRGSSGVVPDLKPLVERELREHGYMCKTCGGINGRHQPSELDGLGLGHRDHMVMLEAYSPPAKLNQQVATYIKRRSRQLTGYHHDDAVDILAEDTARLVAEHTAVEVARFAVEETIKLINTRVNSSNYVFGQEVDDTLRRVLEGVGMLFEQSEEITPDE